MATGREAAMVVVTLDDPRPWWCLIRSALELPAGTRHLIMIEPMSVRQLQSQR